MSDSVSTGVLPEGSVGESERAPAPAAGPSGAVLKRGPGRPPGSKTKKAGKAPAKPSGARKPGLTLTTPPGAPRAPAPAAEAGKPAGELLIKNARELAGYMATAGFLAQHYADGKPRLEILAEGIRWHDPEKSLAAVAQILSATPAGKDPDLSGAAVPAAHVQMAAKLMWPWLLKSGFLSAEILSDEWKLCAGVCILAAPVVPALYKFATYTDKPKAGDKKPETREQPKAAA